MQNMLVQIFLKIHKYWNTCICPIGTQIEYYLWVDCNHHHKDKPNIRTIDLNISGTSTVTIITGTHTNIRTIYLNISGTRRPCIGRQPCRSLSVKVDPWNSQLYIYISWAVLNVLYQLLQASAVYTWELQPTEIYITNKQEQIHL